jgi:hypothetical protein
MVLDGDNPGTKNNTIFSSFEGHSLPKFQALITKYELDTVVCGEMNQWRSMFVRHHSMKTVISVKMLVIPSRAANMRRTHRMLRLQAPFFTVVNS